MRKKTVIFFLFPIACYAQTIPGQESKIDSLQQVIRAAKHDTIIINALKKWDELIYISDPAMDFRINQKIDSLSTSNLKKKLSKKTRIAFLKSKAFALNGLGIYYYGQSDITRSAKFYNESLKFHEKAGDRIGMAMVLNNLGTTYHIQGDYAKAIALFTQSLKICEAVGDKQGVASALNNISLLYQEQGDYIKSLEYQNKSLKLYKLISDKQGIASALNNIGINYQELGNYKKALLYYDKSTKIFEELGNKNGLANAFMNIGDIYLLQRDFDNAIDYFNRSMKLFEEVGNKQGMSSSLINIANIFNLSGNLSKAIEYNRRSLELAREADAAIEIRNAARNLWELNSKLKKYEAAIEMFELYIATRDSIISEENQKEIIRQEYKYVYEKQSAKDSVRTAEEKKVKDAQIAQQDAEIKAKQNQQYLMFGGLGLVLIFAGFMYSRFRISQKQKGIIEEQKHIVEEKNKEITDSINYAKRIQTAILPPDKAVKEYLKNSFILYKPKDIVAGDFYWMETILKKGEQEVGEILLAACDCTGHGVPGAMVSVVCNNGLNRAVREYGLSDPGKILDKTRELVIQEFEKSEEEVKDGMDISLVSLSENKIKWAGANNPLWLIRDRQLIECKANKQPIGKYADPKPFTTHEIVLQKNDSIYIFTDGFQDQFGGEKGKKFKATKFKELLLSIQSKSMEEQKAIIDGTFESWKIGLEQNDDVCIIGIKI